MGTVAMPPESESESESESGPAGSGPADPGAAADPGLAADPGAAEELARRLLHDLDVANDWHCEP